MRDIDRSLARYADNQALTNGVPWTGDLLPLFGTQAISVQCAASNGAAGTVYIDGTNQDGVNGIFLAAANTTVAANGTSYQTFTLTDPITSMRACRLRFVPTASGNVTISINLRRIFP